MQRLQRSSIADLVEYLDEEQGIHERVGHVEITNCKANTLEAAVAEMLATQQMNTRARGDRTYHLIVSFQVGEQPTHEQLRAIETRICESLGLGEHQRVSVMHNDTDNLHMHLAINKIHPAKLTMQEPFQAYRTLAKVCAELEQELRLQEDNHTPRRTVSQGRAADMEQHAGIESLMSWVQRECLPELQRANSWEAVHEVLRDHGLELRERGAGLTIEAQDGTRVKASSVDRGMSKAALEARLGVFQAARQGASASSAQAQQPRKSYEQRPKRSRMDTSALFARYQREREGRYAAQSAALAAAKRAKDRAVEDARRLYRLHAAAVRMTDGRRFDKRLLYAQAQHSLKKRLDGIHESYGRERARIVEKYQRRTWADWLKAEALRGDQEALAALRARGSADNLRGATVQGQGAATGAGQAPDIDTVTKAGTVLYRAGTSAVRDDGQRLQVSREADQEAIRTALRLARQQYGDRINVNGSAAFRAAVVRAAADMDLPITFTDPGLEHRRQALMQKERPDGYPPQQQQRQHAARPGDGARPAQFASGTVRAKPDLGGHRRRAPPPSRDGVRDLSTRDVDGQRQGREGVLPRDVRGGVEHGRAARADALRRAIHRPGGGQGQGREVGQAPPPVARKQRPSSASASRRPPMGQGQPPQARTARAASPQAPHRPPVAKVAPPQARAARAPSASPQAAHRAPVAAAQPAQVRAAHAAAAQALQVGAGRVPVAAVGRKPPPAAQTRMRPLSALDAGPLGRGNPLGPAPAPVPARAPVTPWQIRGAIFSPAAYAAADAYIAERESKRAIGMDMPRHSRFSTGAGDLTFAGLRNKDGHALALLKRGDEVLVMPIDGTTAQRLARTGLSTPVKVNANATISTGLGRGHSR